MNDRDALGAVREAALWFTSSSDVVAPLLDLIGDARIVLIGEATHGTDEFYRMRADLTKALIRTKQFNLVAAEADWPDAYRVNRWVRHLARERGAAEALGDLYSLHTSIDAVLTYLGKIDPDAAARARRRYGCFEDFGTDPQSYAYAATLGLSRSCEDDVVAQWWSCANARLSIATVIVSSRKTSTSSQSRTPGSCAMRCSITVRCLRDRSSRGTCATHT